MLSELIDLLTSNTLEAQEREEIVARINKAPNHSNYQWTSGPEQAMAIELVLSLGDYVVISDKIDEAHEQIQATFDESFPSFPENIDPGDVPAYFSWLDAELANCGDDDGCELLQFDPGLDENMYLFVTNRRDSARILELAQKLGMHMHKTNS